MRIANREIGGNNPPYIVAEISGNHCGVLANAIRLIKAAKRAGASAIKTQCYDADSMTIDIKKVDFIAQNGLWKGRTLYELYEKAHTPPGWHKELYKVAKDENIAIFSSVFDRRGVDLLEGLACPAYKIASFEITDTPLIGYAASTGKPLIISTGTATNKDILAANQASDGRAAFLHCTSEYPAAISRANLARMNDIDNLLAHRNPIGISDHTLGVEIPIAATVLRAVIIEKHLKLDSPYGARTLSEDDRFSMAPEAFHDMVETVKMVWAGLHECEPDKGARQFRRSIYCVKDIKKGETYTTDNIRSIRPGYGLHPSMMPQLLGKPSKRNWKRGDPLS